ncbi:flavodoxin family protein [Vibrio sinensis]|uniref:Flavodoxin family protein n=1 Tax=Vibrio sinensis TaxID=2302434 RepID=A0A3A6QMK9_9VIBR|nr:NAD(P)H-dependent oxidoreductase [Vibrio sinensis]RJX69674.1 flavodoxin family protein [Vibrio sinensis]
MQKNKILVLYAHPSQHRSEINQPLFHAAQSMEHVTAVDLYGEYPTYQINIDKEQQRLLDHDVIIFLFPLYWYSTPSILKEWQDLVLEYGFAYGTEGTALKGKIFLCALSAGGKADAYRSQGYNHFTIRELLYPMEQMASLTGMQYLAPFTIFGSRTAKEEKRLDSHLNTWKQLLTTLIEDKIDYARAKRVAKLNLCLEDHQSGDKS